MKQGLLKTTSITALVIAGGMMANSLGAFAADLGGNCCADLEERVADLEATVARKGTRKTSLEVWGQVNKAVVGWDDGYSHNVVLGTDNVNSSTRFGFRGNAKVMPDVTAGYSVMIEWASGGRSTNISQQNINAAAAIGSTAAAPGTAGYGGAFGDNDAALAVRDAQWWIESKRLGRLSVGRFNTGTSGVLGTIDLSDANLGQGLASNSPGLVGSGLIYRTGNSNGVVASATTATAVPGSPAGTTNFSKYTISNTTDGAAEWNTRLNGVAYTTPTFAGFSASGIVGGAADTSGDCSNIVGGTCVDNYQYGTSYQANVRYANEFHGVRIAAALGWEQYDSQNDKSINAVNPSGLDSYRPDSRNVGLALSLRHVPTGLFVQGEYNRFTRGHDEFNIATGGASAFATTYGTSSTATQWMVQGGITRNWFGLGATAPYVEYGRTDNGFNTFGQEGSGQTPAAGVVAGSLSGIAAFTGDVTKQTLWGIGVNQNIDAAAMTLYGGYRDFSLSSANCTAAGGCKDIGLFMTGAIIKF